MVKRNATHMAGEEYILRWRGREEGPLSLDVIQKKLARREIGLLHQIFYNGQWLTLREFLHVQDANRLRQQEQLDELSRRTKEQEERMAQERSAQQEMELIAEQKRKNDLLAAALKPRPGASYGKYLAVAGCLFIVLLGISVFPTAQRALKSQLEGMDSKMRDRTKSAWFDLKKVDEQMVASSMSSSADILKYAEKQAQIDLDNVDPQLVKWMSDDVECLRSFGDLLRRLEKEMSDSEQNQQSLPGLFQSVGSFMGALANNNRSASDNIAAGGTVGNILGVFSAWAFGDSERERISTKYKPELDACGQRLQELGERKAVLRKTLSDKYGFQLL